MRQGIILGPMVLQAIVLVTIGENIVIYDGTVKPVRLFFHYAQADHIKFRQTNIDEIW